ncbi:ROK family protein [Arthrobacter tecti]
MTPALTTPVLEVGGTHVTAALVETYDGGWSVRADSVRRLPLDAHASAAAILDIVADAARSLGTEHNRQWGVAVPGPFDYATGVARYENVGKFDTLNGIDVRACLTERLGSVASGFTFLNDADAFGIGEHALSGAAVSRLVCITLGTGVGSTFLVDGSPVTTGAGVPPHGECHLLTWNGRPLEETVSRRAIRRQYAEASGNPHLDVHEIADASRRGDAVAARVLESTFTALGSAIAPSLHEFGAESLIIGGSMAGSWDIVYPPVRKGLAETKPQLGQLPITRSERFEEACLVGAARWALVQART